MVKHITLYTSDDAKKDIKSGKRNGLDASAFKWKLLIRAANKIIGVVNNACGLCHENDEPATCHDCPLANSEALKCGNPESVYREARDAFYEAKEAAEKMLAALEALQ